jgi:hypothetical protein
MDEENCTMRYEYDDDGVPVGPSPAAAVRETRRRELVKRTKGQLVVMVNQTLIGSMHPPSRWSKDELITHVPDGEFPAAVPAGVEG